VAGRKVLGVLGLCCAGRASVEGVSRMPVHPRESWVWGGDEKPDRRISQVCCMAKRKDSCVGRVGQPPQVPPASTLKKSMTS
jgi:hypothetical protein